MRKAVAALAVIAAVTACVRIPPARWLPASIDSLYIPVFENRSYTPGLEEKLTRYTQEEFLSDGRLDVVPRRRADVVLVGKMMKFAISPLHFEFDQFPRTSRILMIANVALYDPADRQKEKPLMEWDDVQVEYDYESDARFSAVGRGLSGQPEEPFERAMQALAREIVATVISKKPVEKEKKAVTTEPTKPLPPRRVLGRHPVPEAPSTTTLPVDVPTPRPRPR